MSEIRFPGERTDLNGETACGRAQETELAGLLAAMRRQRECGEFSTRVPVDPHSALGQIAEEYNRVLMRAEAEIRGREEAVEAAQRATEKFRSIFENSAEGIFQTTLEGQYLCVNPALARIYGYSSPEQLMKELMNISRQLYVDPDRRVQFQQALEQHDTVENFESEVYRCDGQIIWISENARVIRDERGRPLYYEGTVVDITLRKEQARLVCEAQERAEHASRAKSEFLANMSHEIRTPMTAILGYAEILLQQSRDAEGKEALAIIKRNGEHLMEVINSILDLSKIEAGRLTAETIACDTCAIIADVASLMRVRAAAKNLPLHVEFRGPIPERITSDPTRLRQILINIVGNAIKFTVAGEVRIVVGLSRAPRRELQFDVADTGIGLTAEQLSRVFEPFTQADASMTRMFGGTGLGLSISRRLAEMLGGTLSAASLPGAGSTFTLTLPAGPIAGVRMLPTPSESIAATGRFEERTGGGVSDRAALIGLRLLLAEDGPDNQALICHLLRRAGAEVSVVENGLLAVEAAIAAVASGEPFDAILMDMQMPMMDGYDAVRNLRRQEYELPIIALTAHAMSHDRAECLAAGCDEFVTKPVDRRLLIAAILHTVQGARSPTEAVSSCAG